MVSADQGHVFHNRLTHSIQVAQVGRRIAEKLVRENELARQSTLVLDPDVVETACLAHDLGHPPFGHIAEKLLDELACANGLPDGFEGNAQSLRIVTKLAVGSTEDGLNLTRATLNALLKYPWQRGGNPKIPDKWGVYESEKSHFVWARELGPAPNAKTLEADLMDWADDVTYSVHDLDDFYRAGVIPLDRLAVDSGERERFYSEVFSRRKGRLPEGMDETYLRGAFDALINTIPLRNSYNATRSERMRLRYMSSALIGDFVRAAQLRSDRGYPYIFIEKQRRGEIFMLKQLTWHYVIKNPALATQQEGQRAIVRALFEKFFEAATSVARRNLDLFPTSVREVLPNNPSADSACGEVTRVIIDFISSLTEEQAVSLFQRVSGSRLGSALNQNVR